MEQPLHPAVPKPELNPCVPASDAEKSRVADIALVEPKRNVLWEIFGTIISMVFGAFIGLLTGGNGLGFVSFVVLCSFMGWVIWTRRRQSLLITIGICILIVIVWWPLGLVLRDLTPMFDG